MFTRVDRYILKQVLYGTLFAVLVLCIVLVLGNIFKQIRPFLVEKGLPLSFITTFIIYLLPFSMIYTIPWSFLASVLMVFGRLSSDNEITALRSSGMSLYRIALPVLILGLAFSGVCLWLNGTQAPHSKSKLKQMIYEVGLQDPMRFFDPGVVQARLKGQRIYIEERSEENSLKGFHAYQLGASDNASPAGYLYADEVDFDINTEERRFDLRLQKSYGEAYREDGTMEQAFSDKAEPWVLPYAQSRKRRIKPDQLDNKEIRELLKNPPADFDFKRFPDFVFEKMRRYSFSFAPLALAFVAIPLGLQSRRKETSAGIGLTVLIAFTYFILLEIAKEIQAEPIVTQVLVWLPNLICLSLGIFLFRRAVRRS